MVGTELFLNSAGQLISPFQRVKPILLSVKLLYHTSAENVNKKAQEIEEKCKVSGAKNRRREGLGGVMPGSAIVSPCYLPSLLPGFQTTRLRGRVVSETARFMF